MESEYNEKERRQSCASHTDSKRIADKMTRLSVPSIKTLSKTKNGDKSAEVAFPNVKKLIRQYDSIVEKREQCSPKSSSQEASVEFRDLKINVENIKDRLDLKDKNNDNNDNNSVSSAKCKNSLRTRRIRGRTKSLKEYCSGQGLLTRDGNVFSYIDLPKHFDGVLDDQNYKGSRNPRMYEVRSYSDSSIDRRGLDVPILPRLDSGTSDLSLEGIPVTFDSWSGSTTSTKNLKRRASTTPLSLSPAVSTPSGSIENFRLTKSTSCGILSFPSDGEWKRSNSSDSAVVVEDECKYTEDSGGSVTPAGASIRKDSHYQKESPFLSNDFWNRNFTQCTPLNDGSQRDCDSEDFTEKDEYIVLRRSTARRTQRNPSVVISDHSGHSVSVHIAYAPEDFSLNTLGSTPDLLQDEYYFPRRKASDCSLCSAFGPGDMEFCICYGSEETGSENISQRRLSDCSTCSYLTASEDEVEVSLEAPTVLRKNSNWRKVRNVVQWSPFIQTYKRHKYPWVQLAGHQGNFKAGYKQGTIMKKLCQAEEVAFEEIQKDFLRPYVPEYLGIVDGSDGEKYLQLQDLLSDFSSACVMDIKMGVRTYLEEELAKARHKPKLRKDMYEKMIQIDPSAPSEAEHRAKAVTKPRYMVWRETISSTATLGFRIEGIRRGDGTSSKDFKTTRTRDQVMTAIAGFVDGYPNAVINYINRLKEIRSTLEKSNFFRGHELIGSSLLFVHNEDKSGVWLIDFAKTVPLPDSVNISHREPWVEGTHEDGYLIGLDNLINLMENLHMKSSVLKPNNSDVCNSQTQESIPDQNETSDPANTEGHQQILPNIKEEKRAPEPEVILSNNLKEKEMEERETLTVTEDLHIPDKKTSKNVTNVVERKVLDETRN